MRVTNPSDSEGHESLDNTDAKPHDIFGNGEQFGYEPSKPGDYPPPPDGIGELVGSNTHPIQLRCWVCTKPVTNKVPGTTVFRGLAYCPECIELGHDLLHRSTQPGAGTTLPTEHHADAATGEPDLADDNAAPPGLEIDVLMGGISAEIIEHERKIEEYLNHAHRRNQDPLSETVGTIRALITAEKTRLKRELLERVGELRSIGVPWTNPDTGKTFDIQDADAVDRRLRAAIEAVIGGGE